MAKCPTSHAYRDGITRTKGGSVAPHRVEHSTHASSHARHRDAATAANDRAGRNQTLSRPPAPRKPQRQSIAAARPLRFQSARGAIYNRAPHSDRDSSWCSRPALDSARTGRGRQSTARPCPGEFRIEWNTDGSSLFTGREDQARLTISGIDLRSGRLFPVTNITVFDPAGFTQFWGYVMTPEQEDDGLQRRAHTQ